MHKIILIIGREYLTRVRKKSFIVMTILGPLVFAGILIVPIWLAASDVAEEKIIAVIDESGLLADKVPKEAIESSDNLRYELVELSVDVAKADLPQTNRYGLLYIPADLNIQSPEGITFYSESSPSVALLRNVEHMLEGHIKDIKLQRSGINKATLDSLETSVHLKTINLTSEGEQKGDSGLATAVGYIGGFLIYGFIFLYGAQVMRGVVEEKSNRIVEIIISSVRPFQLMTGKIIGVALVGLTQFMLWILFTITIITITLLVTGGGNLDELDAMQGMAQPSNAGVEFGMVFRTGISEIFETVNVIGILAMFVYYFLGGYLLYAALFAAVGSASDTDTDSQQFTLPISAPLIFSVIILTAVLQDPNGSLAVWTSIIPFTSPIIMMMRIPFGVPVWQLVLSMALLVVGFIFTTWVASRIYRVGILIHGTKINYRTLGKWLFSNR
jgi:ABC-2 type transport system permease protein